MTDADDEDKDTAGPTPDNPLDDEEEEHIPEDLVLALFEFMEDVRRIEAHVWAAEDALQDARVDDDRHLRDDRLESRLGYERAYFLLNSVAHMAEEAAKRTHKVWPDAAAYSEREYNKVRDEMRRADERKEAEEARRNEE
jgi:hypothetical protein